MLMAELADRSGLPVATIKFYLRSGLLPAGRSTSATRADYDDAHVRRLRLVRALTEVAGLPLEAVRAVLESVDDDSLTWHAAVGSAHTRLSSAAAPTSAGAREQVRALLSRHGWARSDSSPHADVLARALDALTGLEHPVSDDLLDVYAAAAASIAEHEVPSVDTDDRVAAAEQVVVGTLLLEPALLAMRRIAQENVSARLRD
ncbi:MAG TPA: MerR family transcriptional regulator [Nocardioidaceae bacterium]|nr:MerR family transcriptional regulator [Nocardioidaceae bacterium]